VPQAGQVPCVHGPMFLRVTWLGPRTLTVFRQMTHRAVATIAFLLVYIHDISMRPSPVNTCREMSLRFAAIPVVSDCQSTVVNYSPSCPERSTASQVSGSTRQHSIKAMRSEVLPEVPTIELLPIHRSAAGLLRRCILCHVHNRGTIVDTDTD